jgi:luciferase-like monooxygenase
VSSNNHSSDAAAAHDSVANERSPSQQIIDVVTSWPGVTTALGGLGERSFRVGRREIGHLHGDAAAHFGFPRHVWITLRREGRIEPHPVFIDLVGPAARRIQAPSDIPAVIDLFRLNYERLTALAEARR